MKKTKHSAFTTLAGLMVLGWGLSAAAAELSPFGPTEPAINRGKSHQSKVISYPVLDQAITQSTVLLEMIKGDSLGTCTGSLIAPHIVLTAAHCVSDNPERVAIGFFEGPGRFTVRLASLFAMHPQYTGLTGAGNDLALIYFPGSIPPGHAPVRMVRNPKVFLDSALFGHRNLVAGYGVTSFGAGDSGTLRKTELSFSGYSKDTLALADYLEGSSICSGDSGGPAFIYHKGEYLLWGVASFVDKPFCQNQSYYTIASQHLDWIDETSQRLIRAGQGHK